MKRMAMVLVILLGTVGLLVMPAAAATITFGLDYEFSGGTPPAGTAPWVTATFEDLADGSVQLTIAAVGLTGTEFISEFYYNFNPALNAASNHALSPPGTGTQTAWNSYSSGNNYFKADGDGWFDFMIDFPPPPGNGASKFTAGETFVMLYPASYGLTVYDFNFASVNGPEGKTGFYAAAHIQSIGPNEESGWIGDGGNGHKVPEPSTVLLLGSGLVGLAGLGRMKFRK